MFDRRLKLGTYWGIDLYVHWTFALLIGFVVLQSQGEGVMGIAFSVAVLLSVFVCVTLHEYGHALAARQFGIPTIDITLLPIGGVARLQRMPKIAWQELVVAVAGPAVNVVIASLIVLGFLLAGLVGFLGDFAGFLVESDSSEEAADWMMEPSLMAFAICLLFVNVVMVLFNMIPAFPMDGGRVLRSLLAMVTSYRRATFVASRIGLLCAFLMAATVLYTGNWMLMLIAMFIAYAGMAEARQVETMESVANLSVDDCMLYHPATISMETPISEIAQRWQSLPSVVLPVIAMGNIVTGILRLSDVTKAIKAGVPLDATAGELADHNVPFVLVDAPLEDVLLKTAGKHRQMPVVDQNGRLVGLLDLDSMISRGTFARLIARQNASTDRFDALT